MQKVGKVKNYNGLTGNIINEEKKYIFSDNGTFGEVKNDDLVIFDVVHENIASNVRKCIPEDVHTYIKKHIKNDMPKE